ncbi:hypothetical protein Trydic_g5408 [Trypoxylus dichotomus]
MYSKNATNVQDTTSETTPRNPIQVIENPTNVQHITHVTWSEENGFEINTDDEELAQLLQKALTSATDLKTEEDVIQYVSKEFQTTKQDDDIYISYPFNNGDRTSTVSRYGVVPRLAARGTASELRRHRDGIRRTLVQEALRCDSYVSAVALILICYIGNLKRIAAYFKFKSKFDDDDHLADRCEYGRETSVRVFMMNFRTVHVLVGWTGIGKTQYSRQLLKTAACPIKPGLAAVNEKKIGS